VIFMTERDWQWLALYVAGAADAEKRLADIRARWEARMRCGVGPDGWSHYDREALRSGHAGYAREDYGL
jgi:hypothetical protein